MAQYVTASQFAARVGRELSATEITQVNSLLQDASDLVDLAAKPVVIDPSDVANGESLGSLIPIIVSMVRRTWDNPNGHTQEQIGDYMWQALGDITATKREYRLIRRAVGRLGVGTVELEGYLPYNPNVRGSLNDSLVPE